MQIKACNTHVKAALDSRHPVLYTDFSGKTASKMQACCMQGTLAALDSQNPVLYINFPEGRLKFFGTIVFPKNKYMVLKFGNKDVLCEDVLENMVSTALLVCVRVMEQHLHAAGGRLINPSLCSVIMSRPGEMLKLALGSLNAGSVVQHGGRPCLHCLSA